MLTLAFKSMIELIQSVYLVKVPSLRAPTFLLPALGQKCPIYRALKEELCCYQFLSNQQAQQQIELGTSVIGSKRKGNATSFLSGQRPFFPHCWIERLKSCCDPCYLF